MCVDDHLDAETDQMLFFAVRNGSGGRSSFTTLGDLAML